MDATQIATIAAAVSAFAALVSTVITGVAIGLTLRERRASYRNTLYERQLQGYSEILRDAFSCFDSSVALVYAIDPIDDETRARMRQHAREKIEQLRATYYQWLYLLPRGFTEPAFRFVQIATVMPIDDPSKSPRPPMDNFIDALSDVMAAAREEIRVEPLSQENVKIIGPLREPQERD